MGYGWQHNFMTWLSLDTVPNPDEVYAGWVAVHPIGRIGKPEEIAAMAVYLASDEAGFTTGARAERSIS